MLIWESWSLVALKGYLQTDYQTLRKARVRAGLPLDQRVFGIEEVQKILLEFHSRIRRSRKEGVLLGISTQ